jgi:hypothetical protein
VVGNRPVEKRSDGVLVGDVRRQRKQATGKVRTAGGNLGERRHPPTGQQHLPTVTGQRQRRRSADSATSAGDNCDPTRNRRRILHQPSLPWFAAWPLPG